MSFIKSIISLFLVNNKANILLRLKVKILMNKDF